MDIWKYFAVGHRDHKIINPMSEAKLDELIELLALRDDARILDIGCGKAEFLVRTARRWGCRGVGVDLSPPFVADARAKVEGAGLADSIEIVEADGKSYDGDPAAFDAAICMGASWIWGGLEGTLRALSAWARPDGLIVMGEPYWKCKPSPEHLAAVEMNEADFGTHRGNVETGLGLGLSLLHIVVSNDDDWDRYEGYQWRAAENWALANPDDPDLPELMAQIRSARDTYLRWGRDEFGWAIYLFRNGSSETED